jgi:cyclic pyranopterin phosphate synthase
MAEPSTRPIFPIRQITDLSLPQGELLATSNLTLDQLNRPLHDLRISVTDRCNFRCGYCMPKEVFGKDHKFLAQEDLLSFEEITRTAKIFVSLGVEKIRLTGGEPLLRKNIEVLIEQLASIRTPSGKPLDLTLTTNGSLLSRKAQSLKDAGLNRVTVSLDGLSDDVFKRMNDVDFPVADVLHGIEVAQSVGLSPIKVNMVVKRGTNEDQIIPMARYFRGTGITVRYIEYMDVGCTNGWRMDEVLPSDDVIELLKSEFSIAPLEKTTLGETAQRWGYLSAQGRIDRTQGELGFISSVSHAFCEDCNRARLSTEGKLYLCLFASHGYELKKLLRGGESDEIIASSIAKVWQSRSDQYSLLRSQRSTNSFDQNVRRVEMSYIGG